MSEKRLGKGIEALITTHSTAGTERLLDGAVSIDQIIPNHNQPRQEFDLEEMKNQWKDFADIVAFTNYTPWESSYENKINYITTACSELFQRIFVWWDGKVNPCDYDYKSILSKWNVKQKTIKEIWNSDYYNLIRKRHLEKQRSMIEPCKRCPIT